MYLRTFQHRLFLTYDFAMVILTADFYRYTYTYQNFKFWHIKIINKKEKHKKSMFADLMPLPMCCAHLSITFTF